MIGLFKFLGGIYLLDLAEDKVANNLSFYTVFYEKEALLIILEEALI